jgi:hypothetical protein
VTRILQGSGGSGALVACSCALRIHLALRMPSPITLSIPDLVDLNQNLAYLILMGRGSRGTQTFTWRLRISVAL